MAEEIWTTEDEIRFIHDLSVEDALSYAGGLYKRNKWGNIDRSRVLAELNDIYARHVYQLAGA